MRTLISTITAKGYVREQSPNADDAARLDEILESRQFPGTATDREFFAGKGTLADQFAGAEWQLDRVVAEAKRMGYKPNPNDFYNAALANCVGDPLAFIPPTGGRGHIKKVCELRDQDCYESDGKVIHRRSEYRKQPPKAVPLAPDIVERKARALATKHPEKRLQTKQSLREEVIDKHGSK